MMKKNLLLALFTIALITSASLSTNAQGRRPNISTFSSTQQVELRNLIMDYLKSDINPNPPVANPQKKYRIVEKHYDAINHGHNYTKDFLQWHRYYTDGLEDYILKRGKIEFLPLPKWDPTTRIPDAFWENATLPVSDGFLPLVYRTPSDNPNTNVNNFNFSRFFDSQNLCSYRPGSQSGNRCTVPVGTGTGQFPLPTTNIDAFARDLECEHNKIHVAIGGTMTNVAASPGAAIFWIWHAYVDDIYYEYQRQCQGLDPDLYMQDDLNDTGLEPNNQTQLFWVSQDIWVRNQQDGFQIQEHQNPEYTQNSPVYVYVRVRNRAEWPSSNTGNTLYLYWAQASSGLAWTSPFNGIPVNPQQCNKPMGGLVGQKVVRSINEPYVDTHNNNAKYENFTIFEYVWQPPNPIDYQSCFGTGWSHRHFCLLARITPIMGETADFYANLKNNNNTVLKNITLTNDRPGFGEPDDCIFMGNYTEQPMNNSAMRVSTPTIADAELFNHATVEMRMSQAAKQEWVADGRLGEGITEQIDGDIRIFRPDAWIGGLDFAPYEMNELCVAVTAGVQPRSSKSKQVYTFDVVQYYDNKVIGGERYKVDLNKIEKKIELEKLVWIYPNPASSIINLRSTESDVKEVTLIDALGRIHYTNKFVKDLQIDVSKYTSSLYFVKVRNCTTNSIQVEKIFVN